MRKRSIAAAIVAIVFLALGAAVYYYRTHLNAFLFLPTKSALRDGPHVAGLKPGDSEILARDLSIPWDIAFLPDGDLLVTERIGVLRRIGKTNETIPVGDTGQSGEGGLLGVALHPKFSDTNWVYLYQTSSSGDTYVNRVVRYRYAGGTLSEPKTIIAGIPGADFHDGGKLAFGPDGDLYITTGDAGVDVSAQDVSSLAGKVLRLTDDGSVPSDNPFGNAVYSYGHRNTQGLAWDAQGRLWATEHGRSGAESGFDEINLIEKGKNYGWPSIQGSETKEGMVSPIIQSTAEETWAPSGIARIDNRLFFAGLRGESLYVAAVSPSSATIAQPTAYFRGDFGRLRAVALGPDGFIYLTTSNTDGRGFPKDHDDKIIRINPDVLLPDTSSAL